MSSSTVNPVSRSISFRGWRTGFVVGSPSGRVRSGSVRAIDTSLIDRTGLNDSWPRAYWMAAHLTSTCLLTFGAGLMVWASAPTRVAAGATGRLRQRCDACHGLCIAEAAILLQCLRITRERHSKDDGLDRSYRWMYTTNVDTQALW